MADLTQDEAIDRSRVIDVESYDVFLDLTSEPVLSRTELGLRNVAFEVHDLQAEYAPTHQTVLRPESSQLAGF